MSVKFINLSDHEVVIHNARMGDQELVIVPSGKEARVESKLLRLASVTETHTQLSVPVITFEDHYVYGLPEPAEGIIYIVSAAVRKALPHRTDLASPDGTSSECEWDGRKLRSVPGLVMNKGDRK